MEKRFGKKERENIRRAAGLLTGGCLDVLLALYGAEKGRGAEAGAPDGFLGKAVPGLSDRETAECLERLEKEQLAARKKGGWYLTGLGQELEPALCALERFGHLYERARRLDCAEEPEWAKKGTGLAGKELGLAEKEPDPAKGREPAAGEREGCPGDRKPEKPAAMERHGFVRTAEGFFFYNLHPGHEAWYFFGKQTERGAEIWLITGEEYALLLSCAKEGKPLREEDCRLYLRVSFAGQQVCPEQETFYTAAEDALIREALGE